MQNYFKTISTLAAVSAFAVTPAMAEIEYELGAGYHSDYMFRGQDLGNDLIDASIGASFEKYGLDFSAGAWYGATQDISGSLVGPSGGFNELDLYGEVSKDLGFATIGLGYIYYHFDTNGGAGFDNAQELYLVVSKSIAGFDTSIAYYWDIETDNDGYMEANVDYGFELTECVSLNIGNTLGFLAEEGDLTHLQTTISLDWAFTETATLTPYIAHAWSLSEGGRVAGAGGTTTAAYGGQENEFFAGLSITSSF